MEDSTAPARIDSAVVQPTATAGDLDRGATTVAFRPQPLVVFLVACCAGVVADRFVSPPLWYWGLWLTIGAVGWCLTGRAKLWDAAAWMLCLAAAAEAAAWHHVWWNWFPPDTLARAADERWRPICLEVVALDYPRRLPAPPENPMRTIPLGDRTQLSVRVERARHGENWRECSGLTQLTVEGHLLGVRAGDRLRVLAYCSRPAHPRNPGEHDFAAAERTARRLVRLHADGPAFVTVCGHNGVWFGSRWLAAVRDGCRALLWKHLGERQAGLAWAILLGPREHVDPELTEEFFETGTIHVLSISGMHVGILALGLWWLTRLANTGRIASLLITMSIVLGYGLLVEARPPVVRAVVLVVVVCLAQLSGRRSFSFNTLAAAGLIVLLLNPAEIFQVGTQLSFLAVSAMAMAFAPRQPRGMDHDSDDPLEKLIRQSRPWYLRLWHGGLRAIWQAWLVSAVVWLATLPLTMYRFHLVQPIGLIANPVIVPLISLALFAGFGVITLGWLSPWLGDACGWICNTSLSALESVVHSADAVPGGHFYTPGPSLGWVLAIYLLLAILAAMRWHRYRRTIERGRPPVPRVETSADLDAITRAVWRRRAWTAAVLFAMIAAGLCTSHSAGRSWPANSPRPLCCTFISVGHGLAVLVELPSGEVLLYDSGRLGSPVAAERAIAATLWSRGIRHLDAVVVSHADADHYNALPGLLTRFTVGTVYVSPFMFETPSRSLRTWKQAVESTGVPLRELRASQRLRVGGDTRIDVLHPTRRGVVGSDNANSIVLRIDHAGRTVLLTGDLESPGLDDLIAEPPVDCDVLLAPHHGSPRSSPAAFAAWSTPEFVIVSGGDELSPIVQSAYESTGAQLLHTDRGGAIQVRIDHAGVEVRGWRQEAW